MNSQRKHATAVTEDVSGERSEATRLWRRATGLENVFCRLHDDFAGCGRVAFVVSCTGPLDQPEIERALRLVWERCPQAAVQVQADSSGDYEFRIPSVPEPPAVLFRPVRDCDAGYELAVELARQSWGGNEPALRWVVLPSEAESGFQIVGLAHHALFDAAAMLVLIRRFLEVCGSESAPNWEWPEARLPRTRWRTFPSHIWLVLKQIWLQFRARQKYCRGLPPDFSDQGACLVHRWRAADTSRLTDACRDSSTTVTAVLGVAGAMAVRDVYPELSPVVDVVLPIDARRYLPIETAQQTVQLLIASLTFAIDLRTDRSLVAHSQLITSTLREFIANEGPLRMLRFLRRFTPRNALSSAKYPTCVSANSLGKLSLAASPSGVRVVECGWFANGGIHMPAFMQTSATIDGCLAVTSYSTWIAPHRLRSLAERTDFRLREFAGLTNTTYALPASAHQLSTTALA